MGWDSAGLCQQDQQQPGAEACQWFPHICSEVKQVLWEQPMSQKFQINLHWEHERGHPHHPDPEPGTETGECWQGFSFLGWYQD